MTTNKLCCVLNVLCIIFYSQACPISFADTPVAYDDSAADTTTETNKSKFGAIKEKYDYQAEVNRLMDIIINSLYTKKEVFLREVISNAADALEKVRFLNLNVSEKANSASDFKLEIRIDYDKNAKTISITDTGIGMTKQDLINNLGTVAKSGTSNFLESLGQGGDVNSIGQFGVGFYATFLVADKVTVTSKHDDDEQYMWESSANGSYMISKDPGSNTLSRGTRITLHLKEDATDFLNELKLKSLAGNYGKFISFPIYVKVEKTVLEDVPTDEVEIKHGTDDVETKDWNKKQKKKKVEKRIYEWELVNSDKAIWLRPKDDIGEQQYRDFYKDIFKDYADPLSYIHFTAEGEIEFKAILYIPSRAPVDMFDNYFNTQTNIKLYVRRAFVGDKFDSLLPKYLHFIKGVVSSDDLPLNVSREQLQEYYLIGLISKKLVKKTLELIQKMSKDSDMQKQNLLEKSVKETDEAQKKELKKAANVSTQFDKFWKEYSRSVKLGCYEDDENRPKIAKVMRFYTSKCLNEQISLKAYLENARKSQKVIYYISGDTAEQLMKSPHMQIFLKKEIEVLFLLEAMDEPCIQKLSTYEGRKFVSIAKGDAEIEETDQEKKRQIKLKKVYGPLLEMLQQELRMKVHKVELSRRLVTDPCAVVSSQWGYSAHMEKIMKSQTFSDPLQVRMMANQKIFEINPNHPVIINMLNKVKARKDDIALRETANRLFQASMLASGFDIETPSELASIIYEAISNNLRVDPNEKINEVDVTRPKYEEDETTDHEGNGEAANGEAANEETENIDVDYIDSHHIKNREKKNSEKKDEETSTEDSEKKKKEESETKKNKNKEESKTKANEKEDKSETKKQRKTKTKTNKKDIDKYTETIMGPDKTEKRDNKTEKLDKTVKKSEEDEL